MQSPFDSFKNYLADKVIISDSELERIKLFSDTIRLRKGEHLLTERGIWKQRAFVGTGLLRTYRTDESGLEHTIRFAMENWWVGDGESYITEQPSVYNIGALEPSLVICWKKKDFDLLSKEIPALQKLSEELMSRSLIASQHRIFQSNSQSAEEKYNHFLLSYPELARRVPLHMIASYLGVTRETLSRIRRQFTRH